MTATYDLSDRVALISGGARGQGASHARAIVNAGGKVVLGDVLDADGELTAKELGKSAVYTHLDVTKEDEWQDAVDLAISQFGKLNVLVNNAGILDEAPLEEYSLERWNRIISINLTGVFLGCKSAAPALVQAAPASIVNISSVAGMRGAPEMHGYVAAKWGVRGLTKSVAAELGPKGVRCNSIHPGVIVTPMTEGRPEAAADSQPGALKRPGRPEDVSRLVLFLASDQSSYSTGSEFIIDGGMMLGFGN